MEQPQLRYVKTSDGITIAYFAVGRGPAFVDMPSPPFDDVEMTPRIAEYGEVMEAASKVLTLVRYDVRGFGGSDRDVGDFSLGAMVLDLEAVVDAIGLDRFVLNAWSEATLPAVAYAARHPERVIGIVLREGMMRGSDDARRAGSIRLARDNWTLAKRALADAMPNILSVASLRQMHDLIERTTTQDGYIRFSEQVNAWDVSSVAGDVRATALVTNDQVTGVPKSASQRLAASLANASFVGHEPQRGERSPTEAVVDAFLQRLYTTEFLANRRETAPGGNVKDAAAPAHPALEAGTIHSTRVLVQPQPLTFASGRYVLKRVLGEGGQKSVYLVHDNMLRRDCALALLKTELVEQEDLARITREAQAMAQLGAHTNIVTVFDLGEEDGRPYVVCEYVPGGDLRSEMQVADGPLPPSRAISIAADISRALGIAHDHGIVHRDIKPANIWLNADGSAKLGDFGIAFTGDHSRLTITGTVLGTASYMSPEQAQGGVIDARSDLYALGCLLYEMVAGRPPFVGSDPLTVVSQHIHAVPTAPSSHEPDVPPSLEGLILRLLAKSPAQRPDSAAAVLDELRGMSHT